AAAGGMRSRRCGQPADVAFMLGFALCFFDIPQINILQIKRLRWHNDLAGMSPNDWKRSPQCFMACDQLIQAALQRGAIYRPENSPGHGHLINSRARLKVREEPQPLLSE